MPIVGIALLFEGLTLMLLVQNLLATADVAKPHDLWVALVMAMAVIAIPKGYGYG